MASQNASSSGLQLSPAELLQILYKTTGALFLAAFFNTMLYGLMLHQAYRYFRQYTKDAMIIKLIVSFVIVVETAYTVCNIHYIYYDFVTHYATMEPFVHIVWSGNLLPLLGIITGTTTHIFFIRRVSMIGSRYKFLAFSAIVFHIIQTTFALIITVKGFVHANPSVYTDQKWMVGVTFGFALLADFSISGALFGVMREGRKTYKRNGPKSTVDQITIYFVNTGTLVFLLDMTTLILAQATDGNLYWAAVNSITARVFTNTLFCVLNSRKLHAAHGIEIFSDGPLHTISRANRLAAIERWNVPEVIDPTPPKINIAVTTENEDENMSRVESQEGGYDAELGKRSKM